MKKCPSEINCNGGGYRSKNSRICVRIYPKWRGNHRCVHRIIFNIHTFCDLKTDCPLLLSSLQHTHKLTHTLHKDRQGNKSPTHTQQGASSSSSSLVKNKCECEGEKVPFHCFVANLIIGTLAQSYSFYVFNDAPYKDTLKIERSQSDGTTTTGSIPYFS